MAYKNRGYNTTIDAYKEQQEKKRKEQEKQQGPVSVQRAGLSLPKVESHSRQRNVAPGTANVRRNQRVTGTSVGNPGAVKNTPAPVSTQRASAVPYDRAAQPFATPEKKMSREGFNRSPALRMFYQTYDNYVAGRQTTGGGYQPRPTIDTQKIDSQNAIVTQYRMALDPVMEKLASAEDSLKQATEKTPAENWYTGNRPLREREKSAAAQNYVKISSAAAQMYKDYKHAESVRDRTIAEEQRKEDEWKSRVRDPKTVQAEKNAVAAQIKAWKDELYGLKAQDYGGRLMSDILAPISSGAAADSLSSAMNAQDRIKTLEDLIAMGENQIPLLDDEFYWANNFYYEGLANDLPDSVKRADVEKRKTRAYNIVDEPYTKSQKAASYLETFSPASRVANRAVSLGFEKANLAQMTPDERKQYQKIVENYGDEAGAEYINWLNSDLNTRRRVSEENAIRSHYKNASKAEEIAGFIDTILLKPLSIGTYANQMVDYLLDGEIQKDASYNRASYLNTAARAQMTEDFGNFMAGKFGEPWRKHGQEGVQIATSVLDNVYNMLLTAGIGNMAGLTGNAIESSSLLQHLKDASNLTLYVMGTETAADATIRALDRGLSYDQAIVLGTGAGLIEIFTEKVSLDNLLEGLGNADSFWDMVKSTGIQGITEGSEEFTGSWLNTALDAWVSKDKSEWQQAITSYKLSHPHASDKDAFMAVFKDTLSQSLQEAKSGAISGLLMAGGGFALGAGKAYVQNRQNMTSPENINALVESAKDLDTDSDGYKAVQDLQAKIESGKKITPHEVALAQRDVDISRRTNSDYVQKQIAEAKKYENTDAEKKAVALEKRINSGAEITYDNVVDLEQATDRAKATSYDTLKSVVAAGLVSDPESKAFKAAESLQHKMDEGREITLREANAARKAVREAVSADYTSANPELIGRRLITENGRQALTDAATILKDSTSQADVRRGEQILTAIKDGTIDAKTAGEAFLRSQKILENFERNPVRVLQPREVTDDMDAYDRSAAKLGVSVEEAAHNKAIMQAFGVEGEYRSLGNDSIAAYWDYSAKKMVINANGSNVGLSLIAHEVTHSFENTAGYKKLADLVFSQSKDLNADLQRITQEYKDAGINLDDAGARSELVSKFVEQHMFNDEKFINDVVSTDRSLGQKILRTLDNLLAKLGNKNAQQRKLLRDARDLWAEALQQRKTSDKAKAKIAEKRSEAKKGLTLPAVEAKAAAVRKTEGQKKIGLKQVNEGIRAGLKQATLTAGIGIGQNASGKFVFNINGKNVTKVTADHVENHSAFGALISIARDGIGGQKGTISPEEATKQYQAIADLMNLVMTTQNPEMTWEFAGSMLFSAVKSNSDGQYGTTVDFSTVCLKTTNIINALSERMMALGRGLKKAEVTQLQKELADEGLVVPCPVCYVFSRWAGAGSLLDNMKKFQQKYNGKTDAEIEAAIEQLRARDEKAIQADIRRQLREGKAQENQDAYSQLMGDVEQANRNISALRSQVRTAKKNGRAADVEALEDAINANQEWKKKSQSQMEKLERELDVGAQELAWLEQVRTKPGYQPVPDNILFNMASAEAIEEFMTNPHYAMSYRYRTTRGSAMGKAIEPYADMRLGDFILPIGKKSADGNTMFASPLDVDGEFNDDQKDAIIDAIARVRAQNLIGGQRFQSTSDFRYEYALDYIQAFFEAQALGSNMQTYTKVIEFGEMVARIGGDVNLSVMPKNKGFKVDGAMPQNPKGESVLSYNDGDYTGGYLIYSNKTGIDFGAAKLLKDRYGNAQMILVGINDDHIRLALNDQFDEVDGKKVSYTGGYHVGFVIPYHTSGAAIDTFIRDLVSNLGETFLRENYQDYTDVGSDKVKSTSTKAQDRRRNLRKQLLTGHAGLKNWSPSSADISWMRNFAKRQKSMNDIRSMSFEEMYRIEQNALLGDPAAIREYESWSAGMLYGLYKKMWKPSGTEYGVRLNGEQSKTIMPHEYWDTNGTRDKAYVNNFLFRSYCYNLGMTPRFTGINSSGKVTDHGDFSDCKGYWKTLIDRSMYDLDGKYRGQKSINMSELEVGMVHPDWSKENWEKYSAKQPEIERAKEIGRQVDGKLSLPKAESKQYAISKSDTAYLKAVESGDMETAQRMVDEAAKKAGYNSPKLYHGTNGFGFTVVDPKKANDRISFFATDSPETAGTYSGTNGARTISEPNNSNNGTYQIYANTDGFLELDANGAESNHIALGGSESEYNYHMATNGWRTHITAKQAAKYAKSKGYPGVVIRNVIDTATPESRRNAVPANVYVFFNPQQQVKSADPVTYDDSGKPIPLSERFNPENKDIRYAISKDATISKKLELPNIEKQQEQKATKNRQFNESQEWVGSKLKTVNGSDIKRSKYGVGKDIGGRIYLHKNYAEDVIPSDILRRAESTLHEQYPDFNYNCVEWDAKTNAVRFDEAPDFDTAREPVVGDYITVNSDGSTRKGHSDYIWHHKWLWVDNDYAGFDVAESWAWSRKWLNTITGKTYDVNGKQYNDNAKADGNGRARWEAQLKAYGLDSVKPVSQSVNSADTSIKQVPGLFTNEQAQKWINFGKTNIDIGAGKYDLAKEYYEGHNPGSKYYAWDPYNRDRATNRGTLQYLQDGKKYDTATCANVLNVIAEPEARSNVILQAAKSIKPDGSAYFWIYEGNKTGDGTKTSKGWQNNLPASAYVSEVEQWFDNVSPHGKLIVATSPKTNLPQATWEVQEGEGIRYAINKDATIRTEGELKLPSVEQTKKTKPSAFEEKLKKLDGDTLDRISHILFDTPIYQPSLDKGVLEAERRGRDAGLRFGGMLNNRPADVYMRLVDVAPDVFPNKGLGSFDRIIKAAEVLKNMRATSAQAIEPSEIDVTLPTIESESDLLDSVIDPKETAKAGVEDALDNFFAAVDIGTDIPGMGLVSTGTKKNAKLPAGYKAQEAARFFYRKMVDSGEAVTRLGKYSNDPHLYDYYNMARASSNAAVSMIQDAQTDTMGRKVGDSLNDIFKEIRAKGDEYYRDLEAYLYHTHNIDRMSRANPGAVASAQAELEQFRHDNPEIANMADFQIERLAGDSTSFYQAQAQVYMDILRRLQKAETTHNKPVFGQDVTAERSQEAAEKLREKLEKTDGFEEDVEKIYQYIDNLMQYRIDSGLITEDEYERLKEIYPHYVPTFREQERSARNKRDNTTEIGKTIGRAQGGDTRLVPLHRALAQQTFSVVREGSKNRFGQMLLDGKQNFSRGMIKNVEEADSKFNEDTFDEEDVTPKKENTFIVRQGGKRYEIGMDNALYEAVTALSPEPQDTNFLINFVHKGNDLFKALNTSLNPAFLIRNPIRDLQDAGLYSKDLSEFVKQYPLAAKEIAKDGKYWQWYKSLGGLYSSVFDFMTGEVREHGKARKYTLDVLEGINMAVEQAPRLAEFMATVKKAEAKGEVTMDVLMEAIHNAAEVTVNFGRSGKWGKMLNKSVIPFFNPGIQGFDKTVRTFAESKDFTEWAKLAGKCALFGILPAVLNNLLYRKREDWDEMKQSDRDLYYLFPLGNSGVWLRLPKGRALSIFGMATDRLIQGKDADWASFIRTAVKQTAPETKTYWQPLIDSQLFDKDNPGKTWYGGDIENKRMQSLAPGERYDTSTDAVSKWIGKTFNLSPKKVNYLLDQYTGVIGEIFLPLMSQRAHKDLITTSFTVDTFASNRLSSDFYSALDDATYAKNDPDATPEDESAYKYLNKKATEISRVNAAIREIEEDSSLSNKDKQALTRAQYMLRNEIMRDAITQMKNYQDGGTDNDIYKGAEEARAQKARESKTYKFKGQDMSWDDLSGRQKKIVLAQEAVDKDKNADLTDILGNKAPSQGKMYSDAMDAGFSNQTYLAALTAVDDANNGDSNYTNDETTAGLNQAIADGKISQSEANKLWPIISGGSPKNNPYSSGKLELPSVETEASSDASSYENQTYTFKGEEKPYSELTSRQQKIVKSQDAIKANPDADLSDILIGEDKKATKLVAGYQEARAKGISNETYLLALTAIDDTDNGDGNYSQKKEVNPALQELVDEGKISSKDASTIWKIITGGADKNNPFPVGAIRPMGLRLPKIG